MTLRVDSIVIQSDSDDESGGKQYKLDLLDNGYVAYEPLTGPPTTVRVQREFENLLRGLDHATICTQAGCEVCSLTDSLS